jgi:hypothetical protein
MKGKTMQSNAAADHSVSCRSVLLGGTVRPPPPPFCKRNDKPNAGRENQRLGPGAKPNILRHFRRRYRSIEYQRPSWATGRQTLTVSPARA